MILFCSPKRRLTWYHRCSRFLHAAVLSEKVSLDAASPFLGGGGPPRCGPQRIRVLPEEEEEEAPDLQHTKAATVVYLDHRCSLCTCRVSDLIRRARRRRRRRWLSTLVTTLTLRLDPDWWCCGAATARSTSVCGSVVRGEAAAPRHDRRPAPARSGVRRRQHHDADFVLLGHWSQSRAKPDSARWKRLYGTVNDVFCGIKKQLGFGYMCTSSEVGVNRRIFGIDVFIKFIKE